MSKEPNTGATVTITPPAGPIETGPFDESPAQEGGDDPLASLQIKDPGLEAVTETPEETGSETKVEGEAPVTEETKPELEDKKPEVQPKPEENKEKPLLAGRFKTVEALEKAYQSSGIEARRLKAESVSYAKQIDELNEKVAQYELEKEVGTFQEIPREQLKALMASEDPEDRLKANEYIVAAQSHKDRKANLERAQNQAKLAAARKERQIQEHLEKEFSIMENDSTNYPQFTQLGSLMEDVLGWTEESDFARLPRAPELIYYAAYGIAKRQAEIEGEKAAKADKEKAEATALAKAKAAGSSGSQTETPALGPSDDYVDKLLKARPKDPFA